MTVRQCINQALMQIHVSELIFLKLCNVDVLSLTKCFDRQTTKTDMPKFPVRVQM